MPMATMTSKGQVTIPSEIRRSLKLEPGVKLDFIELPGGYIEVRPRHLTLSDLYCFFQTTLPEVVPPTGRGAAVGAALGRDDARIKREYAAHLAESATAV